MSSFCRSCRAEVLWTITEKGKRMPLDATPVDPHSLTHSRGLFVLRERDDLDAPLALAVTDGFVIGGNERAYVSHFATCPNAKDHRKQK